MIVIEHNPDIIKNADWIIDLGPESGHKGGRVMFEGTPAQLLSAKAFIYQCVLAQLKRLDRICNEDFCYRHPARPDI